MDETQEKAIGAVMGALIGDALGVGPHWYYDLDQLKEDYGKWIDYYTDPKPGRYHSGVKAGENSQTGQVLTLLLESVSARGEYVESDFTGKLDILLKTLDGTAQSGRYTDQAMRHVWNARQKEGLDWSGAGSFANTAEAAIRVPVLVARYFRDIRTLIKHMQTNILLTHRDPDIAGQSMAFGMILTGLINGYQMSDISSSIIKMVREAQAPVTIKISYNDQIHEVSFVDAVLQASWVNEAVNDPGIKIEPATSVCRLFGLACSIGFMLPAAYYLVSRFENDFYTSVMTALNGGGNNMARASLTGALAGAQVGISGIPEHLIEGLHEHDHLLDMVKRIVES